MVASNRLILVNAFSLNMLNTDRFTIVGKKIDKEEARRLITDNQDALVPAIGHVDTAFVVCNMLNLGKRLTYDIVQAAEERPTVVLEQGDAVLVAQYRGPRLPEGTTTLPLGANIEFYWLRLV